MIAHIAELIESMRPPALLHSKQSRLHLNAEIQLTHDRKFIPILAATVAMHHSRIIHENKCIQLLLNRKNCSFVNESIKQFLEMQYSDILFSFI